MVDTMLKMKKPTTILFVQNKIFPQRIFAFDRPFFLTEVIGDFRLVIEYIASHL
jgi:hypothetical protein